MARKKIKLIKTKAQINKDMNKSLFTLGGSAGGALAYRLGRNKLASKETDTKKQQKVKNLMTLAGLGAGAAGVIAGNDIVSDVATGVFAVAAVDFVADNFGSQVQKTFGVGLGEITEPTTPPVQQYTIEEAPEFPELPEAETTTTTTVDPVVAEIDKLLSETEQEPEISGLAGDEITEEKILENLT